MDLGAQERAVLRELPSQLKGAIAANRQDESLRRLFPPAYRDNIEADAEYRQLVGRELEQSKVGALETLARTADAKELSEQDMEGWLRALNDIRLWLGTLLDISEDDVDEPEDAPHILYHVLTWLQSLVIDALSEG